MKSRLPAPFRLVFMKVAATVTATLFLFTSFISFLPEKARGAEFILDLYPVADALVYSGEESTNYGSMSSLEVAYSTTTTHGRYSFVRFDISSIPANATIVSARFRSNLVLCEGDMSPNEIRTGQVTSNWAEGTVTWKTMPSFTAGPARQAGCDSGLWWGFEVKNIVDNWLTGENNYGLVLYSTATTGYMRRFNSRESGDISGQPQLNIKYSLPDVSGDTPDTDDEGDIPDRGTPADHSEPTGNVPGSDPGESPDDGSAPTGRTPVPNDGSAPLDPDMLIQELEDLDDESFGFPILSPFLESTVFSPCMLLMCCCLVPLLLLIILILLVVKKKRGQDAPPVTEQKPEQKEEIIKE
ncbi:MAG: DNRLRE domain-containing protein [Candidatus Dojkabacteria bacterium]|nr:DNRLRE domain-containing protein [Candidatus Dojkabacteria bacterium]